MADTTTWTPFAETTNFQDDLFYTVDFETKKVQEIIDQPIVAGENLSQLIKFQSARYYDNIDLTEMDIHILYESPTGYRDVSAAINKEYNDEYLRFGWLVPFFACPEPGTLSFSIEFVGVNYVLKTVTSKTQVLESIGGSSDIEEPVQSWHLSIKEQMTETLETATNAVNKAEGILNALSSPRPAATAADMADTDVIYVYTGEDHDDYSYGYWYYYDFLAEKWKSGGAYATTAFLIDETLTVPGRAADSASTGAKITNLRRDLDKIKPSGLTGKKVVFFGDSISYGEGNNGHSYVDIINEMGICASLVKEAHTSSTVGPYQHFEDGAGYDLLQMIPLQSAAVAEADVVFCAYGGNDADSVSLGLVTLGNYRDTSTTQTVCGYMRKAIEDIRALNPAARIIWLFPQIRDFIIHEMGTVVDDEHVVIVTKAMSDVCEDCNVPFMGLYSGLNLDVNGGHLLNDAAKHPTETGQQLIAENVLYGYPFSVYPFTPRKVVRLFENGTYDSTYDKLVLMLVHDIDVIIDFNGLIFSCKDHRGDSIVFKTSEIESDSRLKEYILTITRDTTKLYAAPIVMSEQPWGTGIYQVIFEGVETIVSDTPNFVAINDFVENIEEGDSWRITWNGKSYTWNAVYNSITGYYIGNPGAAGLEDDGSGAPFVMYKTKPTQVAFATTDPAGEITLKIEKRIR